MAVENLYEFHTRQVFVEESIEVGYILTLFREDLAHNFSEHERGDENHDDKREHNERELPRYVQHNAVYAHDSEYVADYVDDNVREQVGHRRRIGSDARDERADGHFVKLILRQLLYVFENFGAKRVDYALSCLLQKHRFPNEKRLVEYAYGKVGNRHTYDKFEVYPVGFEVVGDSAHEKRQNDVQHHVYENEKHCADESCRFGFEITPYALVHFF